MRKQIVTTCCAAAFFITGAHEAFAAHSRGGEPLLEFTAADGEYGDQFAYYVDIKDDLVIAGAIQNIGTGWSSGAAYLFDSNTGAQLAKLVPEGYPQTQWFGFSVELGDGVAAVGAPRDDELGPTTGAAYLYDISDPARPVQLDKLFPDFDYGSINFGKSVAISGDRLLVGASGEEVRGFNTGAVYVFDISRPAKPQFIAKLLPDDGELEGRFGFFVAAYGDLAVIGAPGDLDQNDTGSAYVFEISTGRQLHKLQPAFGAKASYFGACVAIHGNTVAIGQNNHAFVFDAATGQQIAHMTSPEMDVGGGHGSFIAANGEVVLVGAPFEDHGAEASGAAYIFDAQSGRQIGMFEPDRPIKWSAFGYPVAMDGDRALIGRPNGEAGVAYLYDASVCGFADLTEDGAVGPSDLAVVLGNWGPVPPNDPVADINEDGVVDAADLTLVLSEWGPCE